MIDRNNGELLDASKIVDVNSFKDLCRLYNPIHVFLEKAQCMHKQGVKSTFTYGTGYGQIIGWLEYAMIPYTLIGPTVWTKSMHVGVVAKDAKARSREAFKRLYPSYTLSNSKKADEGIIDAVLIGVYGQRYIL